jgi:excisionase family DNA binding protein
VSAQEVADYLGCSRDYVYEHAVELGARRLGTGPKARLRFSLEDVEAAITWAAGRESVLPESGMVERSNQRRRRMPMGTGVDLLPIRGSLSGRAA